MNQNKQNVDHCTGCTGGCVSDAQSGFTVSDSFQRFNQKEDIFSRSFWDETIHSEKTERFYTSYRKPLKEWKQVDGYNHRDFSLRNAGWHVADFFAERLEEAIERREGFLDYLTAQRPSEADPRDIPSPVEMSHEIKQLLRTVPSALSGTATGVGYSKDVTTLLALAQYIRNLGYEAYASMNDTALSIPMAIQAGLGEYGRHGLLITKEYGPRVRLGKIFTNLPLSHDRPIQFGVEAFCNECRACTVNCPPNAIDDGMPKETIYNQSNIPGVKKWTTDAEKCFDFWVNQVTDCSICIRVCPYNKKLPKWLYQLRIKLMGSFLRKFMLWVDKLSGFGKRNAPSNWWPD